MVILFHNDSRIIYKVYLKGFKNINKNIFLLCKYICFTILFRNILHFHEIIFITNTPQPILLQILRSNYISYYNNFFKKRNVFRRLI